MKCYVCSICSVPKHYEQHCHIAMYPFQDIATSFSANMPWQTNLNMHTAHPQELAIGQSENNP